MVPHAHCFSLYEQRMVNAPAASEKKRLREVHLPTAVSIQRQDMEAKSRSTCIDESEALALLGHGLIKLLLRPRNLSHTKKLFTPKFGFCYFPY